MTDIRIARSTLALFAARVNNYAALDAHADVPFRVSPLCRSFIAMACNANTANDCVMAFMPASNLTAPKFATLCTTTARGVKWGGRELKAVQATCYGVQALTLNAAYANIERDNNGDGTRAHAAEVAVTDALNAAQVNNLRWIHIGDIRDAGIPDIIGVNAIGEIMAVVEVKCRQGRIEP